MPPTILVADDHDLIRELIDRLLRGAGYEVLLATNGEELVRLASDRRPDLVLTDLEMPPPGAGLSEEGGKPARHARPG